MSALSNLFGGDLFEKFFLGLGFRYAVFSLNFTISVSNLNILQFSEKLAWSSLAFCTFLYSFMTSLQYVPVSKAFIAAYWSFVIFVDFSFCFSPGMSRYLNGSFPVTVIKRGLDVGVLVFGSFLSV